MKFRLLGYITGAIVAGFVVYMFIGNSKLFCDRDKDGDFTRSELAVLAEADSIMRVLTIEDPSDLAVLRATSCDFSHEALLSDEFARLSELMVATVTHPSQDGVGIAGPQVGLNRRIVAVQRFDKEGEPFEVYPNISIIETSEELAPGPEGCLSVPNQRHEVMRHTWVTIQYYSLEQQKIVQERIEGFTAVIFQHEVDHLGGVLYIDRLQQ